MADEKFKHIVRIANTDVDGNKPILYAIQKIKGVGYSFANIVCNVAKISKTKKAGDISEIEEKKLNEIINDPKKFKFPTWTLNRRKDMETGEDTHVITGDLQFSKENDLKRLKKIKCYRGIRHMFRLTVRGQRTKSNFRKNKNKGKGGVGVKKKAGRK